MGNIPSSTVVLIALAAIAIVCIIGLLAARPKRKKDTDSSGMSMGGDLLEKESSLPREPDPPQITQEPEPQEDPDTTEQLYFFPEENGYRVCPNCGVEHSPGSVICSVCGQRLQ